MTVHGAGDAPTALGRYEIELRLHALRDQAPGLRALMAERAARAGHEPGFIEEIGLAVDELYAIMLANSGATTVLTLRLAIDRNRVEIDAWVPLHTRPVLDGVRLRVLRTLAESLDHEVDGDMVLRLAFCRSRLR